MTRLVFRTSAPDSPTVDAFILLYQRRSVRVGWSGVVGAAGGQVTGNKTTWVSFNGIHARPYVYRYMGERDWLPRYGTHGIMNRQRKRSCYLLRQVSRTKGPHYLCNGFTECLAKGLNTAIDKKRSGNARWTNDAVRRDAPFWVFHRRPHVRCLLCPTCGLDSVD